MPRQEPFFHGGRLDVFLLLLVLILLFILVFVFVCILLQRLFFQRSFLQIGTSAGYGFGIDGIDRG
jgi:hypothetical protein